MSLEEQIQDDIKTAMKAREKEKLLTLRNIYSKIKDERINTRKDLTDDDVIAVLMRGVKSRKDSIEMYTKGGRQDLVDQEQSELDIITSYLPEQMSEQDVKKEIARIIDATGAKDMKDIGKVMGQAMAKLKGKTDGKLVQKFARELLS